MKLTRINKKLIKTTKKSIDIYKEFGVQLAMYNFENSLFPDPRFKIGKRAHKKTHEYVQRRMEKEFQSVINNYENMQINNNDVIGNKSPIWIFWWQGLDNAPKLVQRCIMSVKENALDHPVKIVTRDNYKKLVDIPDYIIDKITNNKITLTHFSDILRMSLLYTYGGIWMDATLLVTKAIPINISNYSFYTIKHNLYADYHVCQGKWSGFFIAMSKENPLAKFCRDFFFEYWKKYDSLICYLLIDDIISLAYTHFKWAKKLIDDVPVNNRNVFELQSKLNNEYNTDTLDELEKNTFVFKLSYKMHITVNNGTFSRKLGLV